MALTKITANIIEDGAISTASLANTSITADKLAATLDLTGKTITVATATAGDNDTTVASTAFVSTAIANLADSAPETLNTLNELAAALGDDANFSTTVTNSIALKAPLASPDFTGDVTFDTSTLVVDSTNNRVGVNVSSPAVAAHVYGKVRAQKAGSASAYVQLSADELTSNYAADIFLNDTGLTFKHNSGVRGFVFDQNGTERMRIDSSGNVGIGTTSPEALLHVSAADGVTGVLKIEGGKNTVTSIGEINSQLDFGSNDGSVNNTGNIGGRIASVTELTNGAETGMAFYTFDQGSTPDLSEKLRITAEGNVGIGASLPSNSLHVASADATVAHFQHTDGINSNIRISDTSDSFYLVSRDGIGSIGGVNSSSGSNLNIDLTSGNVGIGTTSPSEKLDVNGKGCFANTYSYGSTNYHIKLKSSYGDGISSYISNVANGSRIDISAGGYYYGSSLYQLTDGATGMGTINIDQDGTLIYQSITGATANSTVNPVERFRIDSSGNVGIGTTSPDTLLNIASASAPTLRIENTDGSLGTDQVIGAVEFYKTDTSGAGAGVAGGMQLLSTFSTGSRTALTFSTSNADGNDVERLRIDAYGNVGIGTNNPAYNLEIWGAADPAVRVYNTGTGTSDDSLLRLQIAGTTARNFIYFGDSGDSDIGNIEYNHSDNSMRFTTNTAEALRIDSSGLSLGDTDGDYVSRNNTGGLHVKRGGILMNGPPGNANMSSAAADNCWTYHGQGGRGGSFTSLTISVPNPNNGASGVGYGGFSLEFYIAGFDAKYHSGHFSGYVNNSITLSKRAFWDSSGSGTLSSGSVGVQGFYLTIGFPSMTHPTCKFVINKGGHGVSGPYTNMSGVSITWA